MAITKERLESEIGDLSNLPTIPGVVQLLVRMAEDDRSTVADLDQLISQDQVLSARVLCLVNSPFYGFTGKISSVSHALVLLGFNVVKGLVLSAAVFETLIPEMKGMGAHSLGTALLSRHLAEALRAPVPGELLVAGLLHDLGKVILAHVCPEDYIAARHVAEAKGIHVSAAELEIFGFDHTFPASLAAEAWHLPLNVSSAMAHHHRPSEAPEQPETAALVHLADILARALGYGDPGDTTMPHADTKAIERLGLSDHALGQVLRAAESDFKAGADVLIDWK